MVINNAYIISVIKLEHICTNYIPWSHWDVMAHGLFLGLHLLELKTCVTIFYIVFYVIVNINPIH